MPGLIGGSFVSNGEFCALGACGVKSTDEFVNLFKGVSFERRSRIRKTAERIMSENDNFRDGKSERKRHVLTQLKNMAGIAQ